MTPVRYTLEVKQSDLRNQGVDPDCECGASRSHQPA
jgi:hypothetical protein